MSVMRPVGCLRLVATIALAFGAAAAHAADQFPFDRYLVLEARPMRPAKRMPILTVAPDGSAVIDLWCRTVNGRVELGEGAIRIEAEPLPETLPVRMIAGQCSPERMQADETVFSALTQATTWRRRGDAVEISGPTTLRFYPSTN